MLVNVVQRHQRQPQPLQPLHRSVAEADWREYGRPHGYRSYFTSGECHSVSRNRARRGDPSGFHTNRFSPSAGAPASGTTPHWSAPATASTHNNLTPSTFSKDPSVYA